MERMQEKRITPIEQIGNWRTKRKISFKDLQVQIPDVSMYTYARSANI